MYSILVILFVVSLLLLAISVVKPNLVMFWKRHAQRQQAMKLYGLLTVVLFVLLLIDAPELPDFTGDEDLDSIAAARASQVDELEDIYPGLPKRFDRFQLLVNKSDTVVLRSFLTQRGYYLHLKQDRDKVFVWDSLRKLDHRLLMDLRNRMCAGYAGDDRYFRELAFDVTASVLRDEKERDAYAKKFLKEDFEKNRFAKFRRLNDQISDNELNDYPAYVNFYRLVLNNITADQLVNFFEISNYIRLEKHAGVEHYKTFPELLPESEEILKKWEEILEKGDKKELLLLDRTAALQVVEERLSKPDRP